MSKLGKNWKKINSKTQEFDVFPTKTSVNPSERRGEK